MPHRRAKLSKGAVTSGFTLVEWKFYKTGVD